jgi:hypothetical protein
VRQSRNSPNTTASEKLVGLREAPFVAVSYEIPHALIDVVIDRLIRHQPRPATEVFDHPRSMLTRCPRPMREPAGGRSRCP